MKTLKCLTISIALFLGLNGFAQVVKYLSPIDIYEYPDGYDCEVLNQEVLSYSNAVYKLDNQAGANLLEGQAWFNIHAENLSSKSGQSHQSVTSDLVKLKSYLNELRTAKDAVIDSAQEMSDHFIQDLLEDCAYEEGLVVDDPEPGEPKQPGVYYYSYVEAISGTMRLVQEVKAEEIQKQMSLVESAIEAFEVYQGCENVTCPVLEPKWGQLFARKARGLTRLDACSKINHHFVRTRFCDWEARSFPVEDGFTSLPEMCQNLEEPSEQVESACFDI